MSKIKLIYILSQRYSGSTLLSFLLGTRPDIATIGERRKFYMHGFLKDRENALSCSCGKPFPDCEHWNSLKSRILKRVDTSKLKTNPTEFQLSTNRYLRKFAYEALKSGLLNKLPIIGGVFNKRLQHCFEFNQVLIEECLQLEQADVFLDSSKSIEQVLFLSMMEALDVHVVWLTRDPRAQVNSALKYNPWDVTQATNYWKQEMVRNEQILRQIGVKYTTLNYEGLCHDPEGEMKRLLQFLNLNEEAFSLDFREQTQHIMGNYNMRLGKDTTIAERKEWQKELKPEQIKTIEQMTGEYHQYYSKTS